MIFKQFTQSRKHIHIFPGNSRKPPEKNFQLPVFRQHLIDVQNPFPLHPAKPTITIKRDRTHLD